MSDDTTYSDPAFWEGLVQSDARATLTDIDRLLASGRLTGDARALALRAAARSHFELGEMERAHATAQRALSSSADATTSHVRHLTVMTASIILAEAGDGDAALVELRKLRTSPDDAWSGRIHLQTACVLLPLGRTDEALRELDTSAQILDDLGDDADRWRVRYNRGYARLHRGRLDEAERDYVEACEIAESGGLVLAAAQTHASLGVLHGRARRLRRSVEHFAAADSLFDRCGRPARAVLWTEIDRAEVMMHSGLGAEAVSAAETAAAMAETIGNRTALGDAQILLARARLAAGRHRAAEQAAEGARELLGTTGRSDLVTHALAVAHRSRLLAARSAESCGQELAASEALVADLDAGGWTGEARELRLTRVRAAHRFARASDVVHDLDVLRAEPVAGRTEALSGRYAEALRRRHDGDVAGARDSAVLGLDLVDLIAAEAGTLSERSAAMSLGADLSRLAMEFSIELGDPETVVAAAEGTRARSLHDELGGSGRHRPLTEDGAARLRTQLTGRLGDRCLVEWIVQPERVWAVVLAAGGSRLVDVGPTRELRRAGDRVIAWLDVAASEPHEPATRALAALRELDDLLIAPLELPERAGLVVVPDDFLHAMPWPGLPSVASEALVVAPSGRLWVDAEQRSAGSLERIGAVIGPGIEADATDQDAIRRLDPAAEIATTPAATSGVLRRMLGDHDLVHVAAHGTFRSDRPLLSTVRLADARATVDEILPERIRSRLVVLSSCEAGASGTSDGSEVLGLAAVLLARGAASIVAPLAIVRDLECAAFVAELYDEFARGGSLAAALVEVRHRWMSDPSLGRIAVAASFTCFGSAGPTLSASHPSPS